MGIVVKIVTLWFGSNLIFFTIFIIAFKAMEVRNQYAYRLDHRSVLRLVRKNNYWRK